MGGKLGVRGPWFETRCFASLLTMRLKGGTAVRWAIYLPDKLHAAPNSGLPELGTLNAQLGYSRVELQIRDQGLNRRRRTELMQHQ
jgi:hypothetical protein